MNKKSILRFFAVLMSAILLISGTFTGSVFASGEQLSNSEVNDNGVDEIEYITLTEEELEYTYTEDGKEYKAVEYFLSDTEIESHFYAWNPETNEYEFEETIITTYSEESDIITYDNISTGEVIEEDLSPTLTVSDPDLATTQPIHPSGDMSIQSTWKFSSSAYGTNKPARWSVAIIAGAIAFITKVPATAKFVVHSANVTYQIASGTIYYRYDTYHNSNRETRVARHVFSNSSRSRLIATAVHVHSRTGTTLVSTRVYP